MEPWNNRLETAWHEYMLAFTHGNGCISAMHIDFSSVVQLYEGVELTYIKVKTVSGVMGNSRCKPSVAALVTGTSKTESESELSAMRLSIADRQHTMLSFNACSVCASIK